MPKMIPLLDPAELKLVKSAAERSFYQQCQLQLPTDWVVLFSTEWTQVTAGGRPYDGEVDFVVLVPGQGLLAIEVKGGGVELNPETGKWSSTDRHGAIHQIKDPFSQAKSEKYGVLQILKSDRSFGHAHGGRVLVGHAVFLPDADRPTLVRSPNVATEILGTKTDLADLPKWVGSAFTYWEANDSNFKPLSANALHKATAALLGQIDARPLVKSIIAAENDIRIQLTQQQGQLLRAISNRHRAVISGGAGTGKTVLAVQKAIELAESGKQTLLLCFNKLLADAMKATCTEVGNLQAMTYHQLAHWRSQCAKDTTGTDLIRESQTATNDASREANWNIHLPYALARSCEILPERYDAIIVDEAQDFADEFWLGIEMLLTNETDSHLYIFVDHNQSFYRTALALPITDPPFILTVNCRNTQSIHDFAYRYYQGAMTTPPDNNAGVPIQHITGPSLSSQARSIHAKLIVLLREERVDAAQIAVLVCGQPKDEYFDALVALPLPQGISWVTDSTAARHDPDFPEIRINTVRRFKGLEAAVVFLWGLETMPETLQDEMIYVGSTRATSRLYLAGTAAACEHISKP